MMLFGPILGEVFRTSGRRRRPRLRVNQHQHGWQLQPATAGPDRPPVTFEPAATFESDPPAVTGRRVKVSARLATSHRAPLRVRPAAGAETIFRSVRVRPGTATPEEAWGRNDRRMAVGLGGESIRWAADRGDLVGVVGSTLWSSAELAGVDLDGLVVWLSSDDIRTADQLVIPNRARVLTDSAYPDFTLPTDTTRPTLTLKTTSDHARIDPDGSNDVVDLGYTPTISGTSGKLTVVVGGYWSTQATTAANNRIVSFEGAGGQGLFLSTGNAGVARPRAIFGGSGPNAAVNVTGQNLADGERFVCGIAIDADASTMWGWMYGGEGYTSPQDTSGIGTVSNAAGIYASRPVGGTWSDVSALDILIFEGRTLTRFELDRIGEQIYKRQLGRALSLPVAAPVWQRSRNDLTAVDQESWQVLASQETSGWCAHARRN